MSRKIPNSLHSGKRSEDSEFKYLGSMFDANGVAEKYVNNRVHIAWLKWRETTGVMCDRNISTKLKDKVYKTAIKPVMAYGAECWEVRKKEARKLHTTEMRMLGWARGKTKLDHVRNIDIWKEAHMYPMAEFLREKRLRWFGHVQRRDIDDAKRKILSMCGFECVFVCVLLLSAYLCVCMCVRVRACVYIIMSKVCEPPNRHYHSHPSCRSLASLPSIACFA